MAIQLNEIGAVTVQHIIKELPDALQRANALYQYLSTKGKYKVGGGTLIQFPIKLIKNASQGFIPLSGAVLNVNPSQQLQFGQLNWKLHYHTVNFTAEDFIKTFDAPEAILNYIEEKKDLAMADAIRDLSQALHNSSTTNPDSFDGMPDITAASGNTYAGLLNTDYTPSDAYLPYIEPSTTTVTYGLFNRLINRSKARAQQDGIIDWKNYIGVMNVAVYEAFLNAAQNQQRFIETKMLESGFEGMKVNGVNFYIDQFCPGSQDGVTADNVVYVFPLETMKFAYKYGMGSKSPFDGMVDIPNQFIQSNRAMTAANLICINRRLVSVARNLIAG